MRCVSKDGRRAAAVHAATLRDVRQNARLRNEVRRTYPKLIGFIESIHQGLQSPRKAGLAAASRLDSAGKIVHDERRVRCAAQHARRGMNARRPWGTRSSSPVYNKGSATLG